MQWHHLCRAKQWVYCLGITNILMDYCNLFWYKNRQLHCIAKGWCRQTKRCSIERWHLKVSTSILYQTTKIDYTQKLITVLKCQLQLKMLWLSDMVFGFWKIGKWEPKDVSKYSHVRAHFIILWVYFLKMSFLIL